MQNSSPFHIYFFFTGDPTGLFDLIVSPDVTVLQGCGLGGTSLINANVALECEPRIFEDKVRKCVCFLLNSFGGYSCYRLSTIKGKLKSSYFQWMVTSWSKYSNESEWKLRWVRIKLQTPLFLILFENTNNFYYSA